MHKIVLNSYYETDKLVKAARLDFGELPVVWFKFPKRVENDITNRADPFVYALIFPMMVCGGDFEFDGEVSQSVIDQITMFCRIWHEWCPRKFKPVQIRARIVPDDYRPFNKKLITAFSGGLDAAYTAYKYKKGLDPSFQFELDRSIMLLGADIPLNERAQFEIAFSNAKKMTDDLGIELVPVETNFREGKSNWSYCFGTVIVSALAFFGKTYYYGAASDDSIHHFQTPWGMNPITDQYLTSDTFKFISDGHEHSRTDRANLIKNWRVGLEHLRVCWRNDDKSKNCGHCEKCVQTKLNFMAVGVNHLPSMPHDLTEDELLNENLIQDPHNILYFSEIYQYAKRHRSLSKRWMRLLEGRLTAWHAQFATGVPRKRKNWLIRHLKKWGFPIA